MSQRIADALTTAFSSHSIVFWHDAEGEFSFSVKNLLPDGIELLYLNDLTALSIKLQLERAAPRARFLLYSAKPAPEPAKDWLLDIRLRSRSFHADNASILLEDFGLASQQLRAHLKERAKFLKSKDRVDRLKRWVTPTDAAGDLDRKMIAVLAKTDQPDLSGILLRLFSALVQDGLANCSRSFRQASIQIQWMRYSRRLESSDVDFDGADICNTWQSRCSTAENVCRTHPPSMKGVLSDPTHHRQGGDCISVVVRLHLNRRKIALAYLLVPRITPSQTHLAFLQFANDQRRFQNAY